MVSRTKDRGLLQFEVVPNEPRGCCPFGAKRDFSRLRSERRLGRVESGQMIRRGAASRYGRAVGFIVRLILGGLFIFAGIAKIYDPGSFAIEVDRYQLVPWELSVAIADYLPWLELIAGLSLFHKSFGRGAVLIITVLLAIFTFALAS